MTAMAAVILLVGWTSGQWLLWSLGASYQQLEKEALNDDVHRVIDGLHQQLTTLDEVTREWAQWSEMAAFIESGDPAFRDENLNPEGLQASRIDGLAVFSPDDRAVAVATASRTEGDADIASLLTRPDLLSGLGTIAAELEGEHCGLIAPKSRLLMLCMRTVLDTKGQGPTRGTVVLAREFDEHSVTRLAETTRLNLALQRTLPPAPSMHAALRINGDPGLTGRILLTGETPDLLTVDISLVDTAKQEVAVLQMTWPRKITQHGTLMLERVRVQRWIVGLAMALALLVLVDRLLVARLKRLHRDITRVTTDGDWEARVKASGQDEIGDVARSANQLLGVIQSQVQSLQEQSHTDALTGLPNRRAFDLGLSRAMAQAQRSGRPLSLVLFDLDQFKPYNDRFGHLEGDRVLRAFAQCMRESLHRPGDLPARHGGEEFALLLEDTDAEGALVCAKSIIDALAALELPHPLNGPMNVVTCSAGLATIAPEDLNTQDLVRRADAALYDAKRNGRNRVCTAPD